MRIHGVFDAGLRGVRRQLESFGVAAAKVVRAGTEPSTPDRVELSAGARDAATGNAPVAGLEEGMVDLRLAKYLAVASMKVLETGDEVSRELAGIVDPRR